MIDKSHNLALADCPDFNSDEYREARAGFVEGSITEIQVVQILEKVWLLNQKIDSARQNRRLAEEAVKQEIKDTRRAEAEQHLAAQRGTGSRVYNTTMPFDIITRALFERYTANPPPSEDVWYGPWNSILTTLFPTSQGYVVTPQRRINEDSETQIPDFVIEVVKLLISPFTLRTVLTVEVKNTQYWDRGIANLQRQISRQTDIALANTAFGKVYWIGTIGPHWRYGVKEDDGQDPRALIPWHHVTHDEASFKDLQALADLVAAL